ncbi:MAG: DNA adenine methylase [Dehalococcoidales bacterium]|jgi:adenine-specific DNA-methyltransferase
MTYNISNRRYIGSKAKLSAWIMSLINKECYGKVFLDIFAGTGVIAAAAFQSFEHVIVNDLLFSNYAIYQGFFGKGRWSREKLGRVIKHYNNISSREFKDNYFSKHFGGKYFSKYAARAIGFIREDIELRRQSLTSKEYYILLSSLIYSADKIANTVGHYDAYIQKTPGGNCFNMGVIEPMKMNKIDIYREDSNLLAKTLKADVVYIDPPYNSRQYSRFYHVLETLTKCDNPRLHGVALKPEPENMSDYCKVKASDKLADLVAKLNCKYIVVSYNNTYNSKSTSSKNKIALEQIKEILTRKGTTKEFKKSHKFFNSGKTDFADHQEWIFITKVYE